MGSDSYDLSNYNDVEAEAVREDDHVPTRSEIQNAHAVPEVVNRNKRLFSSLIGHLGSAKKRLEEDHDNIQRQTTMMRAVAEKSTEEFKRLRQRKRKECEFSVKKASQSF